MINGSCSIDFDLKYCILVGNPKITLSGSTPRTRNKPLNEGKCESLVSLTSTPHFYGGIRPFGKPWKIREPKSLKSLRPEIGEMSFT